MATSAIEKTSASAASTTTPVAPASIFTREGIHYFLDLVMDLFPIAEKQDDNDTSTNDNTQANSSCSTDPSTINEQVASKATAKENREDSSDAQEQEASETQRRGTITGESRDSSYVTDNDDDSSVEDTAQDYHFIVGGMNMSRFGGVGGNGYRSTNAINFIPTAVTERTEEDNCSLATGYRLGRSSFSSVFQQSSQQNNIVTSLSSLSQVFMSGINTTVTKSANNSVAGFTATGGATAATIGNLSAALTNVGGTITTTGTIEKNCSNLSEDGTVTTTEESSDDSEKIVKEDTAEKNVTRKVSSEQKLEEQ